MFLTTTFRRASPRGRGLHRHRVAGRYLGGVEQRLAVGDIAGMIVEPSGAGMGINPLAHEKLTALRALARDAGVPFICDENITGFRWAPGGIQSLLDLDPDITLLGKIATGGFPGGVVAGKATLMEQLADGVRSMVGHSGTYNGHPVVATAGIAMIDAVKDGAPQRAATAFASELKDGLNRVLSELGVAGFAYGPASTYWMYLHAADAPRRRSRRACPTTKRSRRQCYPACRCR